MIEKISETEYKETVSQPDKVIVSTLDELLTEKKSLDEDLSQARNNNNSVIQSLTEKIQLVDSKIVEVKALGVKMANEVAQTPDDAEEGE